MNIVNSGSGENLIIIVNKYLFLFVLVMKLILLQKYYLSIGKHNIFVTNCKDYSFLIWFLILSAPISK